MTNSHKDEKTESTVIKVWNDNDDAAGKRAETQIMVTLLANNMGVAGYNELMLPYDGDDETITYKEDGNTWTLTVSGLPVYVDGELQTYSWTETIVTEDSDYTMTDISTEMVDGVAVTTIANTYDTDRYCLEVLKVWDDENDIAGFRPETLTVTLMKVVDGEAVAFEENELLDAAGVAIPTEYTLSEENHWTVMVKGVPKGEFTYTWVEDETELGKYTAETETVGTITYLKNTYEPETIEIGITKEWDDADDRDGIRPDHIDVALYADGEFLYDIRLTEDEEYSRIIEELPKYAKAEGEDEPHEIEYTFTEYAIEGYESEAGEVEYDEENEIYTVKLKNTHEPETVEITVVKVWDDADDQDGIRPEKISVTLTADGETATVPETEESESEAFKATVELTEATEWSYTWNGLPKYKEGAEIAYSIEELEIEGYESEVGEIRETGENTYEIEVTNTHVTKTTEITVKKIWNDNNNNDGKRPGSITVVVLADGEATEYTAILSDENAWTYIFNGLPVNKDGGTAIEYGLEEVKVEGYKSEIEMTGDAESGYTFTVTNSHKDETTEIEVEKAWADDDNRDGNRPESVTMTLYKNNEATDTTVVLSDDNDWYAKLEKLPKYEDGDEIVYTFMEEAIEGYAISKFEIEKTETGVKVSFENTESPDRFCLTVLKVWDDANDQDGLRPDSITVRLFANGSAAKFTDGTVVPDVVLSEENNWTGMVMGLPIMAGGAEIAYSWYEVTVPEGYEIEERTVAVDTETRITSLTNKHEPELTEVPVLKEWNDANDQDGIRPESVFVILMADGVPVAEAELNEGNAWFYTFVELPVYDKGEKITYTIHELEVPGYESVINGDAENGFDIVNLHEPEKTYATVLKVWEDDEDNDGKRPQSIVAILNADGEALYNVELSEGNNWTATVEDLPAYRDGGIPVAYTWTEGEYEGYTLTSTATVGYVTTLTNTHEPETTETEVLKVWDDNDDKHGKRPESIVVELQADGETIGTEVLNEANGWAAKREKLPKYNNKQPIIYSWVESTVPEGYTMTLSVDSETGLTTITNTYHTGKLVIEKTFSENVADMEEIGELTFTVTGTDFEQTVKYSEFTDGKYEIGDLVPGFYTVVEENAFGLITNYTLDVESSTISGPANVQADGTVTVALTNTYVEDLGTLIIAKEWCFSPADAVNTDEMKQLKVTVTNSEGFYVDVQDGKGVITDKKGEDKVELTIADGSRLIITDLPIDTYTVTETNAEGLITGYSVNVTVPSVTTGSATTVKDAEVTIVLKNNYERDYGSLVLKKTWVFTDSIVEVPESAKSGLRFVIDSEDVEDFEPITVYYAQFAGEETFTVKDLPVGTYTVKEYDHEQLLASYGYEFTGGTTEGSALVVKDEEALVELENDYHQKNGGLTIVKTFEGVPAGADLSGLTFEITGPDGYALTVSYSEFENGAYTIADGLAEGTYTVKESGAEGLIDHYTLDVTASVTEGSTEVSQETAGKVELTNTYVPDLGALTIIKTFGGVPEDADLSGLTFEITTEDVEGFEPITVTYDQFTDGAYTITDLFAGDYTVKETNADGLIPDYTLLTSISVTEGSTAVQVNKTATVMLLNIYEQDTGSLTLIKNFEGTPDSANLGGLLFSITGPDGFSETVAYAEFTGGSYTLTGLPVGEYTVEETNAGKLIAGYTLLTDSTTTGAATIKKDETVEVTLTNKYEQDLGELVIKKTFTGVNPTDDVSMLTFRVFGPYGFDKTVTYDQFDDDGTYTFKDIPTGAYLVYEVNPAYLSANLLLLPSSKTSDTVTVAKGMTATVSLVNDYENSNTSVMISKVWDDMDDLDGTRPDQLQVTLLADGKPVTVVTLSDENDWMDEVTDLPMYLGEDLIKYTWDEGTVEGYQLTETKEIGNLTILTNTHKPELIELTVVKVWKDGNNSQKRRPKSIWVKLCADDVVKQVVILDEDNNWTETVKDLPKYYEGEEIVYTWVEQEILGYKQTDLVVDGSITTITNTIPGPPRTPTEEPEMPVVVVINHVGDCFD